MQVIRAKAMGMCFGVKDALALLDRVPEPGAATIRGELVHNQLVRERLRERGFAMVAETERDAVPATPLVVITAHGVSDLARTRIEQAGKELLDTTCPLVVRVHRAARALVERGFHILLIGQPGHVEVQGIVEDLPSCDVIPTPESVRRYDQPRLGVLCQTTVAPRRAAAIRAAIADHNPGAEIRFVDSICQPTKDRQAALEEMLETVEAVVVVGGLNSNNTRELVNLCREHGRRTWHVQSAADLDPSWFVDVERVGLTAGTSTLDETIDQVHRRLLTLGAVRGRRGSTRAERRAVADAGRRA